MLANLRLPGEPSRLQYLERQKQTQKNCRHVLFLADENDQLQQFYPSSNSPRIRLSIKLHIRRRDSKITSNEVTLHWRILYRKLMECQIIIP